MGEIDLSKAEVLGHGAFSIVHLVEIDGRKVAVKTLTNRWVTKDLDPEDLLPDFKEECNILVKLVHPNIIKTFGGSEKVLKDRRPEFGILTEWCEMGTLRKLIFNTNFLYSMRNVTIWSENLFDALDYMLKTKRKIHRDIKTENIFVTNDFIVKLGDFGTTREIDQTCSGTFEVGTLRYRSPPQLDSNKTNEELSKQSPKASSRNDVYALGLVIWQLIERRLAFAKYGTGREFDYGRFIYDVVVGNLKELDPPTCLGKFREIVESCCNFDRSKRPHIEEILKQLQEFNKESDNAKVKQNLDLNDGYPKIDKNQQELIRPIGFDQLENRELIPVTSNNSIPIELQPEPAWKLMIRYHTQQTEDLRDEFLKRFNEISDHEKMKLISEIKDIVDAVNKESKYFHEYFTRPEDELCYLEAQLLKEEIPEKRIRLEKQKEPFDKMNIKEIFKKIVIGRQKEDMQRFRSMLIYYDTLIIETVKNDTLFPNLKFKCFLSSKGEEWILISKQERGLLPEEIPGKNYFTVKDRGERDRGESLFSSKLFDKFLQLPKEWCFENESVSHPIGNALDYFDDFMIKKTQFVQLLERTKSKSQRIMYQNFCLPSSQTSKTAQEIEKDFPIEIQGRPLFQLSSPPRVQCNHEPKCDIKIGGSDERGLNIPYYYLNDHKFFDWTEILDFYYWDIPKSEIQRNSDPIVLLQVLGLEVSNEVSNEEDLDFGWDSRTKYITLLDFSDEYFNGPNVPYLTHNGMEFKKGDALHDSFIHTPKDKRRYWVATPIKRGDWKLSLLDYQGKEINGVLVLLQEEHSSGMFNFRICNLGKGRFKFASPNPKREGFRSESDFDFLRNPEI